jgi:hypothetical protein
MLIEKINKHQYCATENGVYFQIKVFGKSKIEAKENFKKEINQQIQDCKTKVNELKKELLKIGE